MQAFVADTPRFIQMVRDGKKLFVTVRGEPVLQILPVTSTVTKNRTKNRRSAIRRSARPTQRELL